MNQKLFGTERKEGTTGSETLVLTALYAPIVGAQAIIVYVLLAEWHASHTKVRALDRLQLINDLTGLTPLQLDHAFKALEAVGLLRRYERVDDQACILQIIPPLTARQFHANSFLRRAAEQKVGALALERVLFMHQAAPLDKTDYREVTTRFQDLFALTEETAPVTSTLEVPLNAPVSKSAAAAQLNAAQFLNFVTSQRATPAQLEALHRVQQLGLASVSVNTIIDYVVTKNGTFVTAHFETIAQDLVRQGVTNYEAIKRELAQARKAQTPLVVEPITPLLATRPAENHDEWEQIFRALGGEL